MFNSDTVHEIQNISYWSILQYLIMAKTIKDISKPSKKDSDNMKNYRSKCIKKLASISDLSYPLAEDIFDCMEELVERDRVIANEHNSILSIPEILIKYHLVF